MDRERVRNMDPIMLLSIVNMKLRDNYSNLEALVEDYNLCKEELVERLGKVGYNYKEELNQFK